MKEVTFSNTILQNVEIWEHPEFRYINIHKSGSSTVRKCIESDTTIDSIDADRVIWTVLRDPYDRFIDALSYDLKYVGLDVSVATILKILKGKGLEDYIFGLSNIEFRGRGTVRHSMLQTTYLLDPMIDIYVDVNDLDAFCAIHFPKVEISEGGENTGVSDHRGILAAVLDNHPTLKTRIMDMLQIDYYMLRRLDALDKRWHWANGRIF
jgi:hypothetical protein